MPDGSTPIEVTLHPIEEAPLGPQIVSFGVPFPRGALAAVDSLVVVDEDGSEIPSHLEALVPWRSTGEMRDGDGSIRSVLVQVEIDLADRQPLAITILRDAERTLELQSPPEATAGWISVERDDFPTALKEPPVYATLPAEWLSMCGIRGYTTPANTASEWSWYDEFAIGASYTAANDLAPGKQLIDVVDNEPWLFDRTMTFFTVYARTGDVRWLRHGHRSARFYLSHLVNGFFDLAPNHPDLKYSYSQSLFADLMFTGDTALLAPIQDIADAGENWRESYTTSTGFWTERHQTYALLAALTAFEATGSATHEGRLLEVVDASIGLAAAPANPDWSADGCMLHEFGAHEGGSDSRPVCSPWMSALFSDAMWRYYLQSDDQRALEFLGSLAHFVTQYGVRENSDGLLVPWYLASSEVGHTDAGAGADQEHACDVLGLVVRGIYARSLLGQSVTDMTAGRDGLMESCQDNLDGWHRPGSATLAEWRLSPARKFNWWFGSTHDMQWMTESMP
jgi:hypothetical protein